MKHRLIFVAALLIGASYWAHHWLPSTSPLVPLWKGAGVALLAVWAVLEARSHDGRVIALVLALGACGDVLLETHGLVPGALTFLAGHVLATWLYLRHRVRSWFWVPVIAVGLASIAAIGLSGPMRLVGAAYALALGAMAGAAIASRFRHVWAGAVLFMVSDLLVFAQMGALGSSPWPRLLTWPTYFAAQALIAWNVVRGLRNEDLHHRL